MKNKMSYCVPVWLLKLPAGKYTIKELQEKLGDNISNANIMMRMYALQVKVTKKLSNGKRVNVYEWRGAAYYFGQMHVKNKEKLKEKK